MLALLLTTACGGGEEEPRTPPAEPPREIEVDASSTLYGFVGDTAGNPVEGVVVSDGFQCVATDAGGVYEMKRNAAAEYVYYSVPAEFKIRTDTTAIPISTCGSIPRSRRSVRISRSNASRASSAASA